VTIMAYDSAAISYITVETNSGNVHFGATSASLWLQISVVFGVTCRNTLFFLTLYCTSVFLHKYSLVVN